MGQQEFGGIHRRHIDIPPSLLAVKSNPALTPTHPHTHTHTHTPIHTQDLLTPDDRAGADGFGIGRRPAGGELGLDGPARERAGGGGADRVAACGAVG